MPEYIEKIRVTVRVSRPGEPAVEGAVSLATVSEFHSGPETLLELLNAPLRVIPFERQADHAMLLLNRHDLQWVMASPQVREELIRPQTFSFTREERVCVRMQGGAEMEGVLQMELPERLNRASDYLNGLEDFFPLSTQKGIFLIHKHHVRETRLFDSSPLPVPDGAANS